MSRTDTRDSRPTGPDSGPHGLESAEERNFRAEARAWLEAHARPRLPDEGNLERYRFLGDASPEADAEHVRRCKEWQRTLYDGGWAGVAWPKEHGGRGGTPGQARIFAQEEARFDAPTGVFAVGIGMVGPTLIAHGTEAQKDRYLPALLRGDDVWCQLFSEPGAGSDLASLRTKAERTDGGWLLTGQKVWTSVAERADWGICLARTDPEAKPHTGITYFLVDMKSAGIDIRPLRELTGDALFNEVFLDGVFVPDDCVVGEVNGGWRLARTTLANERVAMAGSKLGDSVELAITLVSDVRRPSAPELVGRAIALAQVVKLLGTRSTLRSIAGQGPGAESSVAKLVGVRSRQDSAELAMELLGDEIFTASDRAVHAADLFLRNRCLSIAGGTTQVLRNVAGERILGLPRG